MVGRPYESAAWLFSPAAVHLDAGHQRTLAGPGAMEFLIQRMDGEWFDLRADQFGAALRPSSFPSRPVAGWGDHRIEVAGVEVSFSYEDPGIQVAFEGALPEDAAEQIVTEILENVIRVTGQQGRVVRIA